MLSIEWFREVEPIVTRALELGRHHTVLRMGGPKYPRVWAGFVVLSDKRPVIELRIVQSLDDGGYDPEQLAGYPEQMARWLAVAGRPGPLPSGDPTT